MKTLAYPRLNRILGYLDRHCIQAATVQAVILAGVAGPLGAVLGQGARMIAFAVITSFLPCLLHLHADEPSPTEAE